MGIVNPIQQSIIKEKRRDQIYESRYVLLDLVISLLVLFTLDPFNIDPKVLGKI